MGMTTMIIDGSGKLHMAPSNRQGSGGSMSGGTGHGATGIKITNKRPSAGLDFIRLVIEKMIESYQSYLRGWTPVDDGQPLVVLRRTTEQGMNIGFVHFVNGKLQSMPEKELLKNYVIPEGLQDRFEIVNAFLNKVPRCVPYFPL